MTTESQLERKTITYTNELIDFLELEGVSHGVGVIGDSNMDETSYDLYKKIITEACVQVQSKIGNFVLVCGGTQGGVPEMTVEIGENIGLPTIGVFPDRGTKYALKIGPSEKHKLAITIPPHKYSDSTWGTETPSLISIPDAFILVGGEWGTLAEVSMILKLNKDRSKNKINGVPAPLPPLPIIIIENSGKIADHLIVLEKILPTTENSIFRVTNSEELTDQLIKTFR